MIKFQYNDGGRSQYFKAKKVGDCVTRAISIATQMDYKEVYDLIRKVSGETPRDGVKKEAIKKVLTSLGWEFTPLMTIGSGCTCHLNPKELPSTGRYILSLSGHYTAYIDGVLNDTYDCSRNGERCVYGLWHKKGTNVPITTPKPKKKILRDEDGNVLHYEVCLMRQVEGSVEGDYETFAFVYLKESENDDFNVAVRTAIEYSNRYGEEVWGDYGKGKITEVYIHAYTIDDEGCFDYYHWSEYYFKGEKTHKTYC